MLVGALVAGLARTLLESVYERSQRGGLADADLPYEDTDAAVLDPRAENSPASSCARA